MFPSDPYLGQGGALLFDKMPIRQYLYGERFDPETTRLLGIAFETAIQALHNWGVVDPRREAIARAIIGFAKAGERDPERLCDLALEVLQTESPTPVLFRTLHRRRSRIRELEPRAICPGGSRRRRSHNDPHPCAV